LILDSTVFIDAERRGRTVVMTLERLMRRFKDDEDANSAVTAAELVHGIWRAGDAHIRAGRESFVEEVFARVPTRPLTLAAARIAGRIDAELRRKGTTIPTADLWIGATAIEHGFTVATGNARHFKSLPGLRVRMMR
jgi:predicted nucleic acid-binding protein